MIGRLLAYKGVQYLCVAAATAGTTAVVTHEIDRPVARKHVTPPAKKRVIRREHVARTAPPARQVVREREAVVAERPDCTPVTGGGAGGGYIAPWGGWNPYPGTFPGTSIFPGGSGPGGHSGGGSSGGPGPGRPPISVPGTPAPGSPGVGTTPPIAAPVPEPAVIATMGAGLAMAAGAAAVARRRKGKL
jgi:hypothetical protein